MVNIDLLQRAYFTFDKPVPYTIKDKVLTATPIKLDQAETFLASIDILQHDKNSSPSVEIIQMSYLEYLVRVVQQEDKLLADKLTNILHLCWGIDEWHIALNDKGKVVIFDQTHDVQITAKQFDEMNKIILYQNILHYDDAYVNPEFKRTMEEVDAVKNFGKEFPSLERKMYIIAAHTGITKQQQKDMTFREHQGVFEEVTGEVEFTTTRAIAMYCGKGNEIDHWIYRKKRGKYDGYMISMGKYKQSFGGDSMIAVAQADGNTHVEQFLNNNMK